ncbi:B-cell receptor-associated protein 31 isoform X2 [Hydra vulgaris]|uniref:Endoplasmic reticulum transmembrane protein n=1 Tax=Hydra vulgaris TaxID=6087 RepID=A0ABM4DJ86_HYDVU
MSLEWLSAAAFLYTEIGLGMLFCLGFVSNARWQRIFNSRLLAMVKQYGNFYFSAFVLILFVLFLDSLHKLRKYSIVDASHADLRNNPQAEIQAHMKLFRAQRNIYISGFSLFMLVIIRRLATLISRLATVEASCEAAIKQAKGASDQADKLLQENQQLKKSNRVQAAESASGDDIEGLKQRNARLIAELNEKDNELKKMKNDLIAMKTQSEGLHKEYDRLLEERCVLEKKLERSNGEEKKDK